MLTIIFFILGLIIGSFLNVVILRYNTGKSFRGRSGCMTCRNLLSWYELIPLISFVALGGKCKNCKTKISFQYPLVELSMGLIFMGLLLKFQDLFYLDTLMFSFTYGYYVVMFSLLMIIAVYDLKHKIIPDLLSFIFGALAFVGMFFFSSNGYYTHIPNLSDFLSGLVVAVPFSLFWFLSKGAWMGLGDAKLSLGLGWFLGLSMMLSGVVVAFWSGAIIGLVLISFSKMHGMKSEIPFAPFLVFGSVVAFLFELHLFPF